MLSKEYFTVKEAAERLGFTEQTVRNYIHLGRFNNKKIYNSTVISVEEIENYIKQMEEIEKQR